MSDPDNAPAANEAALTVLPELLRLKQQLLELERRLQSSQPVKEETRSPFLQPLQSFSPSEDFQSSTVSPLKVAGSCHRDSDGTQSSSEQIPLSSEAAARANGASPSLKPSREGEREPEGGRDHRAVDPCISPNEDHTKRYRRRLGTELRIETSPIAAPSALEKAAAETTVRGRTPTLSLTDVPQPQAPAAVPPSTGRKVVLKAISPRGKSPRNRLAPSPFNPPSSPLSSATAAKQAAMMKEVSPNKRKHQDAEIESVGSAINTPETSPKNSATSPGSFDPHKAREDYAGRSRFKRRRKDFSLKDYFMSELLGVQDLGNAEAFRYERVQNFFHVPLRVEKLIIYGFFVSCDCFLYVFTYLPIRIVLATVKIVGKLVFPRHAWFSFHRSQAYDLMRGLILVVVSLALTSLDMSRVYHYIRGQAMIKLYVLSAMIEIFDKLGSSLGQDILDGLYWTTRLQPYARRLAVDFVVATIFVLLHAMLLFCQLVTVNIAINSSNSALLTLLISNNFAELKTVVFKKFEEQNLFQISCSDIVERFKLTLFTGLIILQTISNDSNAEHLEGVLQGSLLMMLAEVLVDWIKHAFISKFNRIDAEVYTKYVTVLSRDLTLCRKENVILDHTHAAARRLGLSSLPLACVVIRMVSMCTSSLSMSFLTSEGALMVLLAFLCLVALKILNSIILMSHACRFGFIIPEIPSDSAGEAAQNLEGLVNIERYSLYKKEIV